MKRDLSRTLAKKFGSFIGEETCLILVLLSTVFATELSVMALIQVTPLKLIYTQILSSMKDAGILFNALVAQNILAASVLVIIVSPLILFPKRKIESQLNNIQRDREVIINQLTENLNHFESSADKLRNPLAILIASIEVKDDMSEEKFIRIVSEQASRIHKELEGLREEETKTYELVEEVYNNSINHLINN